MPEQYKAVIPPHQGDKNPSEKVLKLARKITDVAKHKLIGIDSDAPEYWGLMEVCTDEMAEIGLNMKLRTPYTFEEMCKINPQQTDKEHFQKILDDMSFLGILEYDYGYHYDHNGRTAPQSERRYILPMFVPGSAELLNMDESNHENKRLKDHPALASFFERMTFIPLDGITQLIPEGGSGVGMHVIPVEKAIEANTEAIDIEKLSYWLKKYEGHIGVGQCSCRASRAVLDEGCADDQWSWCIGVGDFADYCRETGKGHDITADEAIRILKIAEDNGFVHQITNIDGENKIFGICNCNVNICNALRTSQLFNTPNMSRSAYTARVDKNNCVACGKCVEYCPSGAVKLGQKLCKADKSEVKYPKVELPDNMSWGKDKYDEDYRDNNRINCYDTGTSPCKSACPAHIAVQGYIKKAKEGKYRDALALIKKDNPLPAICGRICNKRCEDACTRGTIDEPVAIDDIKRFIAEQDLKAETRYIPPVIVPSNTFDHYDEKIAIIGAGPAGLSAAYYLATRGYKPTVFEKNKELGGMLTYGVPSFKLEKDIINAEIDVIKELGVEFKTGIEVGKDITIPELRKQGYKAFYIAIGCQGGKRPGIPGEFAPQCSVAVDFLKNSYMHQSQKINGDVVIIGGGNVAIDCARTAHRLSNGTVSMFSLESRENMPATLREIQEAEEEDIKIYNEWGPKEVVVDELGNVEHIILKKCTRLIDPETKKFDPQYDEKDTMKIDCKAVVFAIGQTIEWGGLLKDTKVTFWHGNYPIADALTYQTADPDIFVGGDVYTGPKFAIDAIEAGKCAAESLHRYVHPHASMTIGRNRRKFISLNKDDIYIDDYDHEGRHHAPLNEKIDHKKSFKDATRTLTEEQVKAEASRCLSCGQSIVDENKCIGCGVCTTKCDFDAIHLFRTHPKASRMYKAEDKFKHILPYALKRAIKIKFGKHTKEEKASEKKHKEWKKAQKASKKQAKQQAQQ